MRNKFVEFESFMRLEALTTMKENVLEFEIFDYRNYH